MPNTELVEKNTDIKVSSYLPDTPENLNDIEESCENCHQPINGPFCGQCGQQAESTLKYFWVVIMHLLDDIFSFDSRASRTLFPLVAKPGFLTNEYFAGRRVHYVPPLRLYLFISIVFFITLKFAVGTEDNHFLNINNKQAVITEIKDHIKLLKEKEIKLKEQEAENIDELLELSNNLVKFSTLLSDINKDYSLDENKDLIEVSRKLAKLELVKYDSGKELLGKANDEYNLLTSNIAKIKRGESVEIKEKQKSFTIANNADGTLSFDFLSKENNKKLEDFSKMLTKKSEKAFNSDTTPLVQEAISKLPQLMFILLPIFAVLLKIMFLFSKRLYMEHLTVALHSHSFIFFTILLVELLSFFQDYSEKALPSLSGIIETLTIILLIWVPIYLFIMQKRVYKQGYILTTLKYIFISNAYMLLIIATGVIAFIWGLTDV